MNKYSRIEKFREDSYSMLVKSKDATFELMDSIMTMEKVGSVAQLSLSPFLRASMA
jgi:hypothetical protein